MLLNIVLRWYQMLPPLERALQAARERAPCSMLQSPAPQSCRRHRHPPDKHQSQPQHQDQPTTTKATPTMFTTIATAIMRICNPSTRHSRATTPPGGGANLFPGNIIVTRTTTTTVSQAHYHHHQSSDQQQQAQANPPLSQRQ